jgi:hypothetical protein
VIDDRSSDPRDFSDHRSRFTVTSRRSAFAKASARQFSLSPTTRAKIGGKGIRTPDFQLAKLALYQLSYAPCKFSILDCESRIATGAAPIIAEIIERSSSQKLDCLLNVDNPRRTPFR